MDGKVSNGKMKADYVRYGLNRWYAKSPCLFTVTDSKLARCAKLVKNNHKHATRLQMEIPDG